MRMRKAAILASAAALAVSMANLGIVAAPASAARTVKAASNDTAIPAVRCSGSPQRCDDLLQNQSGSPMLNLGNSEGTAILFGNDGSQTQRWDIYQLRDGNYVIYNNGTSNVVTRGTGCMGLEYCAIVEAQQGTGDSTAVTQQWTEIHIDPFIFEGDRSGSRCLDNYGGDSPPGTQVGLYPCHTNDLAEQWLAKSSE